MKDELKSLEKHLGEFNFNSRIPFYNDSSDYTTNAPSYYDDLARKNKLIKHLALRIWDYDKEILKRLAEWDKNLEEFDDEVLRLLKEWMSDGTFEEIINEVIFGKLNRKIDDLHINVIDYGIIPGDKVYTQSDLNKAIDDAMEQNKPLFFPSRDEKYLFSGDIDLKNVKFLKAEGIIELSNDHDHFIIGNDSTDGMPRNYHVHRLNKGILKVQGLKGANVEIGYTEKLLLYADRDIREIGSIAYNNFILGYIKVFEIDGINKGWVNENKFYGGRVIQIYFNGDYNHNNNIFYGPTVEGAQTSPKIHINIGMHNHFYDVRFEGGVDVYFSELAFSNTIEKTYANIGGNMSIVERGYTGDVVDEGRYNFFTYKHNHLYKQKTVYELTRQSKNYDIDEIKPLDNDELEITGTWVKLFDSGKFKVHDDFVLRFHSDLKQFHLRLSLFDLNGFKITNPVILERYYHSLSISPNDDGYITQSSRNDFGSVAINHSSEIGYMQVEILSSGSNEDNKIFSQLVLYMLQKEMAKTHIPTKKMYNHLRSSTHDLDENLLDVGDIVYIKDPVNIYGVVKSVVGWQYLRSERIGGE